MSRKGQRHHPSMPSLANDAPSAEQAIRQRAEEALGQQTDRALEEDASLSREAIREALEAGRTLGWLNNLVFGKEEWLTQLFSACVTTSKPVFSSDKNINVKLINLSDLPFELINKEKESQVVQLPAHSSVMLTLPKEAPARVYKVKNLFSGSASNLEVTIRPAK